MENLSDEAMSLVICLSADDLHMVQHLCPVDAELTVGALHRS